MILNYEGVKDKPNTLRAMTSLDRPEFEELCRVFDEVWNEHTHQHDKDPAKGGRKPILKTREDRLFFYSVLSENLSVARSLGTSVWYESRAGSFLHL
jgi:hypothetical protein